MVWYLSTLSIAAYLVVRGFLILRAKRGFRDFDNSAFFAFSYLAFVHVLIYEQPKSSNTMLFVASSPSAGVYIISLSSSWVVNFSCTIISLRYILPYYFAVLFLISSRRHCAQG